MTMTWFNFSFSKTLFNKREYKHELRLQYCRKSFVHIIDAKTMSADPVAVVELPQRIPYGFHACFVTEVCVTSYCLFLQCVSFSLF